MRIRSIASGSRGNAYLVEQGDAVGGLLDAEAVDCFRLCVLAELLLGLAGKLQIGV